MSSAQGLS
uniref:Uncharacterized protein n=1 Tax=Anguilla anguilla TaxID=7936 RepID=A0A0E9UUN7_ANGAN